jgi:heme/copper-type cytochrome/quinol oxidase subunit 4
MDMPSLKTFRNQIVLGLVLSLVTVLALTIIGITLVIPFNDLRFVLGLTIVGAVSLLVSLIRTDDKGQWSVFYWFGIVLLTQAFAGVLWTIFIPDLSRILLGFWIYIGAFALIFLPAFPLFNFISTKKATPDTPIETTSTPIET